MNKHTRSPIRRFPGARRAAAVGGALGGSPGPQEKGWRPRAGRGERGELEGGGGGREVSRRCLACPGRVGVCWERGSGEGEGGEDEAHRR